MKCVFIYGQIMVGQNPNLLQKSEMWGSPHWGNNIFEGERVSEGREILELRTCHSFPPQSTWARRDMEWRYTQRARQEQLNAEQSIEIQSILLPHYQSLKHNFLAFRHDMLKHWNPETECCLCFHPSRLVEIPCGLNLRNVSRFNEESHFCHAFHVASKCPVTCILSFALRGNIVSTFFCSL